MFLISVFILFCKSSRSDAMSQMPKRRTYATTSHGLWLSFVKPLFILRSFDKSVVNEHADGTHKEYFEFGAAGEKFRVVEQKVHHRKFRLGTAFAGGHPVDDLIFVAVAHNVVGVEIEVDYVVGFGQGGNIVFKFFGFFCRKKSKKPVVKGFERDASDVAEFVGVRGMNVSVKRGDDFPGRKQNRGVFIGMFVKDSP